MLEGIKPKTLYQSIIPDLNSMFLKLSYTGLKYSLPDSNWYLYCERVKFFPVKLREILFNQLKFDLHGYLPTIFIKRGVGFEPTVHRTTVFKTVALNHSAILIFVRSRIRTHDVSPQRLYRPSP